MWALIKDNKIETMYRFPKSIILNEVRYPSNMFTLYTASEKEALGIYPVLDTGTKGDDRFENTDGPAYTFDAGNKRVTTAYTITERKLDDTTTSEKDYKGNDIVNLGLKSVNLPRTFGANFLTSPPPTKLCGLARIIATASSTENFSAMPPSSYE